ncbi:MAG: fibro-slime domain-containing protein [Fibrobacter sp.]|nr:fibro-slime domain-containing protein [Fibrobacter sp.]
MRKSSLITGLAFCLTFVMSAAAQPEKDNGPEGHNGPEAEAGHKADAGHNNEPNEQHGNNANVGGSGNTVIRFMPYWTNTSAIMIVDGKETVMTAVKNYCGWYEARTNGSNSDFYVRFKQTVGDIYIGGEGPEYVSKGAGPVTEEILLDSVASLSDTIWVRGYKNDIPGIYAEFPKVLNDCPTRYISVMMFDWLHGDGDDDENAKKDEKLGSIYAISNDFGSGGCSGSPVRGMVEKTLGKNGVPVRSSNFPNNCKITDHLDYWFLPLDIGKDSKGNTYTNATCRDLELNMDSEGYWVGQKNKNSEEGGLFFLDDFEYLDENKTVKNIFYDNLRGIDGKKHNFGFTMKVQAKFEYVPGQYFEFLGDDDVWVFINNKLVVDIGGQHEQVSGAVYLDTLGLTPGETYPFHIFYVERHTVESNFKMRTSMDLHTDASMFLTSRLVTLGKNDYNVWQINKTDMNLQSCSFDFSSDTEIDTVGGRSNYHLSGGSVDMDLNVGSTYFAGIKITSDTTFTIDSVAIVDDSDLPAGHYFLEVSLKSNASQKAKVEIIVPGNAPGIVFADENWNNIGTEISGNTATIGKWGNNMYPVHVTFKDPNTEWSKYNKNIKISSNNPDLLITDAEGNSITSVSLDPNTKQATFYVMANGPVTNATLTITGSGGVKAYWTDLNFIEAPVPHVKTATIYDRNGDGRGDKVVISFDDSFGGDTKLDSVQIYFGEMFPVVEQPSVNGNSLTITTSGSCEQDELCGFGTKVFTGGATETYVGSMTSYITYKADGETYHFIVRNEPITDGIGPVITRAHKSIDGSKEILELTFSEAISSSFDDKMLQFKSNGSKKTANSQDASMNNNKVTLIYIQQDNGNYVPEVGDFVHFASNEKSKYIVKDLLGNEAHEWNPWVTIVGEQSTNVTSPGIVTIDPDNQIIKNDLATQPQLADSTKTAKQIAEKLGVQGNLIGFTLASVVTNKATEEIAALEALIAKYMGDSIVTTNNITRDEAIVQLFKDIRSNQLGGSGISDEAISAIIDGKVTASNYKSSGLSNDDLAAIEELIEETMENNSETIVNYAYPTEQSVLDSIASGAISAKDLADAGISEIVLDAIKSNDLNANTLDSYARGMEDLIKPEDISLTFKTKYYSHLGDYINGTSGTIKCNSKKIFGNGQNCLTNSGNIFLAWNMKSKSGKLVGTGVYVSRLEYKITVAGKTIKESTRDFLMGVRRK